MTDGLSRIEKLDRLAEGGIIHPNAGMLWVPDQPHDADDETLVDDFTQELLEVMTEPIGDIPEGAYTCCFFVKQEIDDTVPDTPPAD